MSAPGEGIAYSPTGRLPGTFVYMILCKEGPAIFAKIGVSGSLFKRISQLLVGCPLEPYVIAYVELPTRFKAFSLEATLHQNLKPWRARGEWFKFGFEDKTRFNEISQQAMREMTTPSWPLTWTKMNARELIKQRRTASQARLYFKRKWRHWRPSDTRRRDRPASNS